MGFRSGDWLGHSRTLMCFFLSLSFVDLAVCFGSLSCWNTHPQFIFNAMAGFNALALTVHGPVHRPFDVVQLSCPLSRKTPPKHNVSTSMFDGGDQWRAQVGGRGGFKPLPLWGLTLKCPCGPVCAIWTISWTIKISTAAVCVGPVPEGHHPSCSKKKKTWCVIPAPATAHASCLRLNADDHNWWTTMPVKRHQQSKKKMKTKPARHFQVGYIHNQRSIKTIYIYMFVVIKTDLSQQQPLKLVKMNYIKTMRQPSWKNRIEHHRKF